MNRNSKEKTLQILIRAKPKDKARIKQLADKCNLSVSEYMVQRALGYEPKSVLPDAFYRFYSKLCDMANELNHTITPETETKLCELVEYIHSTLLLPYKKSALEIKKEMEEMLSGPPESRKTFWGKEHPRSGEPFGTCDESDERSVM